MLGQIACLKDASYMRRLLWFYWSLVHPSGHQRLMFLIGIPARSIMVLRVSCILEKDDIAELTAWCSNKRKERLN
ncbi:hypothetical protein BRADI_2g56932v3 [Brachypodium distachyon]|uniref:Uncharacterized protein n=1 Tax=Brachypodium distachyon TaxID=15368 RepID=A0A2K2DGA8_BRADI|nr:hypothetical protein BRADI_2g56932v3 [Brachypodium distachyon]